MKMFRSVVGLLVFLSLAVPALGADFGMTRATFLQRYNAAAEKQALKTLPATPIQTQKNTDKIGPLTINVYAVNTLVVMLNSYDAKPDTLSALAVINQLDGIKENEEATILSIDCAIQALNPKLDRNGRNAILKGLALDKGLTGAIMDGKRRQHVAGKIRYMAGVQQGKGITFAAYPAP